MTDSYKMPYREQNSNKGTFGKVLNVAGSGNYVGAAYLSSVSALKIGAGYVALASEKSVRDAVAILAPDVVLLERKEALKTFEKYNVLLIGCGLGMNDSAKHEFVEFIKLAKKYNIPAVIDADGLNILAKKQVDLPQNTVITPHPAEAARLLGVNLSDILEDLEGSAKKLTQKYNCTVVLKTHRTVICNGNELHINQNGNSALAKAGSGDVLAGTISGLIAQGVNIGVNTGVNLFEASKLGVYLHARAGEIASGELTEYSVLASDLLNYLPKAIKEINQQP